MSMEEQGINGGPSVGIEDSKFLLESSLNQHSISMPQDSKFSVPIPELSNSGIKDRQDDLMESPSPELIHVKRNNMTQQHNVQSDHKSSLEIKNT